MVRPARTSAAIAIGFATVALFAANLPAASPAFSAKVERVVDGDGVMVSIGSRRYEVRLSGIDAPEAGQPHGEKATAALRTMVLGKTVRIVPQGKDRYGRGLGVIWIDGKCVNVEMVRRGHAWWFRRYSPNSKTLAEAEKDARANGRGLWAAESPVSPRQWRAAHRKKTPVVAGGYWLNTSSNVRHNSGCRYYQKTKKGRSCGPDEGRACGMCGG